MQKFEIIKTLMTKWKRINEIQLSDLQQIINEEMTALESGLINIKSSLYSNKSKQMSKIST